MRVRLPIYIVCLVLLILPAGCSLKKNTAATRQYSEFITRYNVYFNGDEHYRKTLSEMEKSYADDYLQTTLFMHPAEAYADPRAPKPSGDFTRSIEKAQKAIQLRSIKKRPRRKSNKSSAENRRWQGRSEYNPFLHNAWLMLGRSQYMGGDFMGASSTFAYVAKNFRWLPETVVEADLWRARCFLAMGWLFEAETILGSVRKKDLTDSALENLYDFDMADFYVRSKKYEEAIPYLRKAARTAASTQKPRLMFLLGQLLQLTGKNEEAYDVFGRVASMGEASHRTRFNARIKQSEVFGGNDISREVKSLRSLAGYGANRDYLDQIYYAVGNLYMSRKDTVQALENYSKAVGESKRDGVEAALASLALGKIYYAQRKYDKAQPRYTYAVTRLPESHRDYAAIKATSDILDELAVYARNVNLQDSLLRLAGLTPEKREAEIARMISELEKRERAEEEARRREEYLARQEAAGTNLDLSGTPAPASFTLNTDKSWYFYNEATRNAGRVEFQKRWGNRKLEDDWRRRNKAVFSQFEDIAEEEDPEGEQSDENDESPEAINRASDPHFPEYYLRQIPMTPAARANALDIIQDGMYNQGIVLKDKLNDFDGARTAFSGLIERFPDNVYRLDAYYNMYLMGLLSGRRDEERLYRKLILEDFPESKYAVALADPTYMDKLRRMPHVEDSLYQKAFDAYFANDNTLVRRLCSEARRDYPMSRLMPKFMFLEALSYVPDNDTDKFASLLRELAARYPEADVAPLASSYLRLLAEGRRLNSGGDNVRGILRTTRLLTDSTAVTTGQPARFGLRPDTSHVVLLVYEIADVAPKQMLFDVARHNFMTYSVRDFDIGQLQFGGLGIIMVSGFRDRREAEDYQERIENSGVIRLPEEVMPVVISEPDFDLLQNEGRTLDEYFNAVGDSRLEQVKKAMPDDELIDEVTPSAGPSERDVPDQPEAVRQTAPEIPVGSEGDDPLLD